MIGAAASTTVKKVSGGGGGGGYTGPGDITSFAAWWGLRAYTTASIGNNVVDVFGNTTSTSFTFVSKAGGGLEMSAGGAAAFVSGNSGAGNMVVQKLYDQTGGGNHIVVSGAPSPPFVANAFGSFPVVRFTSGTGKFLATTAGVSHAQPWTASAVLNITTAGAAGSIMSDSTNYGFTLTSAPALRLNDGSNLDSATLSTGVWYPVLGVFNGSSSVNRVAATEVSGTIGTAAMSSSHHLQVGDDDFNQAFIGDLMEVGFTGAAESSGNRASLISNQQSFWGI